VAKAGSISPRVSRSAGVDQLGISPLQWRHWPPSSGNPLDPGAGSEVDASTVPLDSLHDWVVQSGLVLNKSLNPFVDPHTFIPPSEGRRRLPHYHSPE